MMKKLEEINAEIIKLEKEIEGQHDNGLTGTLVMKHIKCGKPDCKCMQGYRHGPYPHIQYYQNGILKTIYIKKHKTEEYRQKIEDNKEFRKIIKQLNKLYRQKIKLERKMQNLTEQDT